MTDAPRSDALLAQMMALHPTEIDLTLDRMLRLLEALGHPERALPPVIHIAGTNGKGSTLAMIRAGLEATGARVHAYTSPHLVRFHERISLAGEDIGEELLVQTLEEVLEKNAGQEITFFEATTAAGILGMSRVAADYTLLEVGLGGILDATNVVDTPRLAVITPISVDHVEYLGPSLAGIAGEKAGIIKRGVPCVVSRQEDEARDVIEAWAERLGAPLLAHGQHWHAGEERGRLVYQDESGLLDLPLPALPGAHQISNAGTALAALRALDVPDHAYEAAVTEPRWPARMQRLTRGPLAAAAPEAELWLDGGHNPAAGEALAAHLAGLPQRETHLICGMLDTKDIAGYLRPLSKVANSLTAVSIAGSARTLSAEKTAQAARSVGLSAETAESPQSALEKITRSAPRARILICGSLYLAGDILLENG